MRSPAAAVRGATQAPQENAFAAALRRAQKQK
jgi:hypothetical protein